MSSRLRGVSLFRKRGGRRPALLYAAARQVNPLDEPACSGRKTGLHDGPLLTSKGDNSMDLITFKNTQGPIKARYAGEAKEALLTLKATGTADDSAVVCKVETGRGLAVAGIHPKCGGSGLELCSGDMLLEALIACAGVSMRAAAAVLDIPVGSIKVSAEGDVDLRGTLGVSDDVPVGFKEIRLAFDVDADASLAQLDQLAELTDKYCVVFQTIQNSPKTSVRVTRKV